MDTPPTNVAVLGSTGSIGVNSLAVIEASGGRLRAIALSANSKTELALAQAIGHRPRWLVITDDAAASRQDWSLLPDETELLVGHAALEQLVGPQKARQPTTREAVAASRPIALCTSLAPGPDGGSPALTRTGARLGTVSTFIGDDAPENAVEHEFPIDIVLAAIVGSAGLRSTWAAVEAGRRVAIANKETLVVAGPLVMEMAAETGAVVLPVDSEHSAVFQCLQAGRREELRRIILTASGGPFRRHTADELARVTVADALRHPNWNMGPKITVDSATMMNKALEMIEARWLFDLRPEQIDVVVHPQSVVHSMVEFKDGSVIAQLSPPDMKLPIQYALCYPERFEGAAPRLDLGRAMCLEFEPPDLDRFPAVRLGREAAQAGGTAGAVLNAANEAAVGSFLAGRLGFSQIVPACQSALERHTFEAYPSLERLFELDRWAREEVTRWERN